MSPDFVYATVLVHSTCDRRLYIYRSTLLVLSVEKMQVKVLFRCSLVVLGLLCVHQAAGAPLDKLSILARVEGELRNLLHSGKAELGTVTCDVCKIIVGTIQKLYDTHTAWDDIADVVGDVCYTFKIEDKVVCKSIAQEFKDEILSVIGRVGLNPSEVCGGYLGTNCGSSYDPWNQSWSISIPGNKPPLTPPSPPKPNSPVVRILHLTDLHWDPKYTPGLSNDCGEPLCCREGNDKGSGSTAAGFWGDYNCDVPFHTLENLFQYLYTIRDEFDFVYLTGDLPAHNVWEITRDEAINSLKQVVDLFQKYLPEKKVFPTFGNHESVPVNSFPPPFVTGSQSLDWLLEPTMNLWGESLSHLPDWDQAKQTIMRGGFYNLKVMPGLRVISMQTNFCNNENYWLLINSTDPSDQLQWLVQQLLNAEKVGDKVHMIGHIPPGNGDCLKVWSSMYYKIVNRFESTIIGQFMGHTHTDSFSIFYDEQDMSRATSVVFIAPGVTSYQGYNMGFRIYTIDGDYGNSSHALLDHQSWYMDVAEANKNNATKWEYEYSAKISYRMTGMAPSDWDQLVKNFVKDDNLFQEFYRYYLKRPHTSTPCSGGCKTSLLCDMVSSKSGDRSKCNFSSLLKSDL